MNRIIFSLVLITSPAFGQQPAQAPLSPMEQALNSKLVEEYNQNIQLRASLIQAQARVKELEAEKAKQETK